MAKRAILFVDVNSSEYEVMSLDVAKKGIDWALSWKKPEFLRLRFSHFEPLLEFDLVKQVVAYAEKQIGKEKLELRIRTDAKYLTKEAIEFVLRYKNSKLSLNVADFREREKCQGLRNLIKLKGNLLKSIEATNGISPRLNLHCASVDISRLGDIFNFWVDFGFRNIFVLAVPYRERLKKRFKGTDFKALQKSMRMVCDRYVIEMRKGGIPLRVANINTRLKHFARKYSFSKNLPYAERLYIFSDFEIGIARNGDTYFSDTGYIDKEYYGFGNVNKGIHVEVMEEKKNVLEVRGEENREKARLNCEKCEFNRVCWLPNSNFILPLMRGDVSAYYRDFCRCSQIQLIEVKRIHNLLIKNKTFLDLFYSDSYPYYCPLCDTHTQYSGKCSQCGNMLEVLKNPLKLKIKEVIKEFD